MSADAKKFIKTPSAARLAGFERKIGYAFEDRGLLTRALTHSSFANERSWPANERSWPANENNKHNLSLKHNEMLEFLGDAILGFVIAEELFVKMPGENEGRLSQKRAAVICEKSLALCANDLKVGDLLLLGSNLKGDGDRKRSSILSDAMEAIFAAVYLDGGFEAARGVIIRCLAGAVDAAITQNVSADSKSRLQEHFFAFDKNVQIRYTVTEESGPAHMRRYTSQVEVNGNVLGTGEGGTKKESEQRAAREALDKL